MKRYENSQTFFWIYEIKKVNKCLHILQYIHTYINSYSTVLPVVVVVVVLIKIDKFERCGRESRRGGP